MTEILCLQILKINKYKTIFPAYMQFMNFIKKTDKLITKTLKIIFL
jgi:hypothetical protein